MPNHKNYELSWTVEREVFHLPYGGSIYTLCWLAASLGQRWYPWFAVKSSQLWEVSSCGGGTSKEWKTALLGAWSTGGSGGRQKWDLLWVPKRSHTGVMCHSAGVQCGGLFLVTRFWSYLTPNGSESFSFPRVLVCVLTRAYVSDPEPLGNSGGSPLGKKEEVVLLWCVIVAGPRDSVSPVIRMEMCRKHAVKAVSCSLPALWGNVWSSALCFPQM